MGRIVILGGGESGVGSALLAQARGFDLFLSDFGAIAPAYKQSLIDHAIPFEEGGHRTDLLEGCDTVIKSPGIPDKAPIVRQAVERGIPVVSEIEFAGRFLAPHTRTICITGSNGKTTTTSLIHHLLRQAGWNASLAGNIGDSLALQVARTEQPDWYVIELSSFQLDGMFDFRADIALLLNITPDHLDRYDYQMSRYVDSKFRIARNQRSTDTFICNADDPEIAAALPRTAIGARPLPFSVKTPVEGAWFDGTSLHCGDFSIPFGELKIKGMHNAANALAAIAACRAAGLPDSAIRRGLTTFTPVEHRLEPAGTVAGVEWINDSKATNVDSAWYALQSMTRPTVWIAGGTDKGNDYAPLLPLVREHVKALVCMGIDNRKLLDAFDGVVPAYDTHSLAEAVERCRSLAADGDTVLLSPACASFDLFKNYEDRGRQFKAAVERLAE